MKAAWFSCLFALLCGCSGIDVGNGRTKIGLTAYENEPMAAPAAIDPLEDGTVVSELFMSIREMELRAGVDCSDEGEDVPDLPGPYVADVANEIFLGGKEITVEKPLGDYCEVRFDLHAVDDQSPEAPPSMVDLSIRIAGTANDGRAFVVASDLGEEIRVRSEPGRPFQIPEAGDRLFVAFEIGSWFQALNLTSATGDPILVDDDNNTALLDAFEDAVEESADLFRDQDADDHLDSGEHDVDDKLGD
jgi:hypothetical protein